LIFDHSDCGVLRVAPQQMLIVSIRVLALRQRLRILKGDAGAVNVHDGHAVSSM